MRNKTVLICIHVTNLISCENLRVVELERYEIQVHENVIRIYHTQNIFHRGIRLGIFYANIESTKI